MRKGWKGIFLKVIYGSKVEYVLQSDECVLQSDERRGKENVYPCCGQMRFVEGREKI